MISDKKEQPKVLAAAAEVQTISRSMLVWANTFPDKPVAIINYEFLDVDMAKSAEVGMTLSTIPGTFWADIKRNISLKCSIESNRETA